MDSELKTKIEEYRKNLESELKKLKNERQKLVNLVSEGKKLSKAENKRNQELAELISKIEERLAKFKELSNLDKIENDFNTLTKKTASDEEKAKAKKRIVAAYKKFNKELVEELKNMTGHNYKSPSSFNSFKATIKNDFNALKTSINSLKNDGISTKDLEEQLEAKEFILKEIEKFEAAYVFILDLETDLNQLDTGAFSDGALSDDDKKAIIGIYTSNFSDIRDEIIEQIKADMDEELEINPETKDEKKHKSNTAKIIGAVILGTSLILSITKLAKDLKKNNVKNPSDDYSKEETVEIPATDNIRIIVPETTETLTIETTEALETEVKNENIDKLMAKGYDEYTATLMAENFNDETINSLLEMPYIETVKAYASTNDFNINYLNDYEMYREMYNVTPAKIVDYVNRSYQIMATGFYEEATVDDIIKVVMAIDNKELFTTENAALAQSINTSFNRVVDHYLFGTITEEDINKLDAIKYFAKESTDLGRFLNRFGALAQDIVRNPEDSQYKDNMTQYISIYATSLNGFTNEPATLTDDQEFNENAQVNDYFDWYMSYCSFVGPLGDVLMYPRELQDVDLFYAEEIYHDTILLEDCTEEALANQRAQREELLRAYGYGDYLDSIFKLYKIYDLRELMLTALKDPEITNICGQSRTLGGE